MKNSELKTVKKAVLKRADLKDWYVLKYDVKTSNYNNKIVFKTLKEALKEFKETQPSYSSERVELMFAPDKNDAEFGDNIVVAYKNITCQIGNQPIISEFKVVILDV